MSMVYDKYNFQTITIWDRIRLLFYPMHIWTDKGQFDGDYICTLFVKLMKGNVYVLKEQFNKVELKEQSNE